MEIGLILLLHNSVTKLPRPMIQKSTMTHCTGRRPEARPGWARRLALLALIALLADGGSKAVSAPVGDTVGFNDVRRILSENCFNCHGPDAKVRKSGKKSLRLDGVLAMYAWHGKHHTAHITGLRERMGWT